MAFRLVKVWPALALLAFAVCLVILGVYGSSTTFALAGGNLELTFVIIDAETESPIPNSSIDLVMEGMKMNGPGQQVINLVADNEGKARFVHEDNSWEYVIRPFRKTVTLIDLTWGAIDVPAKGYSPVERMWLQTAKYDNKGYSSEDRLLRVEFTVPLQKREGN